MTCGKPATKSRNASITWSRFLVVLKSLLDLPSLFLIPSIRKPNVAVEEIVSLQTMYLRIEIDWMIIMYLNRCLSYILYYYCWRHHNINHRLSELINHNYNFYLRIITKDNLSIVCIRPIWNLDENF